jgi:quinol monooxygenase YgiN
MVQLQLKIVSSPKGERKMFEALDSLVLVAGLDRGCTGCRLFADANDPRLFFYEEDWASREDLEREIRSDRFTRLLSILETAAEKPVLEFRFVSETRGLDYVGEVREKAG